MEVHLTPEQQARLEEVAMRTARNPERLIEAAVERILDCDEQLIAAAEEGRAAAQRGDLPEHDEVVERVEQILRS